MDRLASLPPPGRPGGTFLWEGIINGPVRSRRLGVSLGLNLVPLHSKLCSFDCPYCECGRNTPKAPHSRWPSPDLVADALRKTLELLGEPPDRVTFAGNGEPTMHPRFPLVVERVLEVRDHLAPRVAVVAMSNGLSCGKPAVRAALDRVDERLMKLDPGPVELVNGVAYDRDRLVEDLRGLVDVTVQALVVAGPGYDGSSEASVGEWLRALERLQPKAVQVYSIARPPADPQVRPVARARLEAIAARARGVISGSVEVF
ncbi:MAG TPA: radical SAM protein [Gemmatimonadales bacterium]|nr:radical SAM protein [Gemmatimonadales bacterium]